MGNITNNPVSIAVKVISGKWKPLIIWLLAQHEYRFGDLHASLGGVSQKMLAQHLRELENDSIVERKVYAQVPPRVDYRLTEYGKTLLPVLQALGQWGATHMRKA